MQQGSSLQASASSVLTQHAIGEAHGGCLWEGKSVSHCRQVQLEPSAPMHARLDAAGDEQAPVQRHRLQQLEGGLASGDQRRELQFRLHALGSIVDCQLIMGSSLDRDGWKRGCSVSPFPRPRLGAANCGKALHRLLLLLPAK